MKKILSVILTLALLASAAAATISLNSSASESITESETADYNINISNKEKYVSSREITDDPDKEDITMILVVGQSNSTTEVGYPTELAAVKNNNRESVSEVTTTPEKNKVFMAKYGQTLSDLTDSNDIVNLVANDHVGGYSCALGTKWNELTGEKVAIIQTAVGATCMHQWVKDSTKYQCLSSENEKKSYYANAVYQFSESYNALKEKYNIKHSFYIWNQGENDESRIKNHASEVDINSKEKYFEAFKSMHEDLLNDLPLDFGGINVVRSHYMGNSMGMTAPRYAQYRAANELPGCYMASRIFETCDEDMMQQEPEGSFGIHALQKTYNAVGTDAAINLYNAVIGDNKGLKSIELLTNCDGYGLIQSRFNAKGEVVAGSKVLAKDEVIGVALSPCGNYTVSFSAKGDKANVDEFGTPVESMFSDSDELKISITTDSDVVLSADQEVPTTTTTKATTTTDKPVVTVAPTTTIAAEVTPIYDNAYFLYGSNSISTAGAQWENNDKGKVFSDRNSHGFTISGTNYFQLYGRSKMQYAVGQSIPSFDYSYTEDQFYIESGRYNLIALQYVNGNIGTYKFSASEVKKSANYFGTPTELTTIDFTNTSPCAIYSGGKIRAFELGEFELKDGVKNKITIKVSKVESANDLRLVAFAAVPVNSGETTTAATDITETTTSEETTADNATESATTEPTTAGPTAPSTTVENTTEATTATTTVTTAATTTSNTPVIYDAYDAVADGPNAGKMKTTVAGEHKGFTGKGFVDYFSANGSSVTFTVDAPSTADYAITFRYEGYYNTFYPSVYFDGVKINTENVAPDGNKWVAQGGSWHISKPLNVNMTAGTHEIKLVNEEGISGSSGTIDCLYLTQVSAGESTTAETSTAATTVTISTTESTTVVPTTAGPTAPSTTESTTVVPTTAGPTAPSTTESTTVVPTTAGPTAPSTTESTTSEPTTAGPTLPSTTETTTTTSTTESTTIVPTTAGPTVPSVTETSTTIAETSTEGEKSRVVCKWDQDTVKGDTWKVEGSYNGTWGAGLTPLCDSDNDGNLHITFNIDQLKNGYEKFAQANLDLNTGNLVLDENEKYYVDITNETNKPLKVLVNWAGDEEAQMLPANTTTKIEVTNISQVVADNGKINLTVQTTTWPNGELSANFLTISPIYYGEGTLSPTTTTTTATESTTAELTTAGPTIITTTTTSEVTTTTTTTSTTVTTTTATEAATTTTTTAAPTTTEAPINYGDANSDGKVTAADVLIIRKSIAGQNVTLNSDASDVNCDGKLTAADVLMIRKYIAGQDIVLGK